MSGIHYQTLSNVFQGIYIIGFVNKYLVINISKFKLCITGFLKFPGYQTRLSFTVIKLE